MTCPPVKVRADRSSSAGPLLVNDEGKISPVLTFTPMKKQTQCIGGHVPLKHCRPVVLFITYLFHTPSVYESHQQQHRSFLQQRTEGFTG